jgi:hypothetical protein
MTTNNDAFEKWHNEEFGAKPSFNRDHEGSSHWDGDKQDRKRGWDAATTEANKRIKELEVQLQNWKDFSKKVQKIDFNDYLQLQASNNDLREALDMLVITKEYKDKQGKDAVYETMRTNAWNVAEQALSATPAESLKEVK